MNDLFSIVIPTHNRGKYVEEAINSALGQSSERPEVIVVDDGSTDNTRRIVAKYGDAVKYIYQERMGVSAARNRGIAVSRGSYIIFLDSDDVLCSDAINIFSESINTAGACKAVFGIATKLNLNEERIGNLPSNCNGHRKIINIFQDIIRGKVLVMGQFAVHRSCIEDMGGFNEKLIYGEDWEFLLRLTRKYDFLFVPCMLVKKRDHDEKRNYADKATLVVTERLRILEDCFKDDALSLYNNYLGDRVIADWYRSAGFTESDNGNKKAAMKNMLLSLKKRPLQADLYAWLIYRALPRGFRQFLKRKSSYETCNNE